MILGGSAPITRPRRGRSGPSAACRRNRPPRPGLRLPLEGPAVPLRDGPARQEPEAEAARSGREERLPEPRLVPGGDPGALVRDGHHDRSGLGAGRHVHVASDRARVHRVQDQGEDRLTEAPFLAPAPPAGRRRDRGAPRPAGAWPRGTRSAPPRGRPRSGPRRPAPPPRGGRSPARARAARGRSRTPRRSRRGSVSPSPAAPRRARARSERGSPREGRSTRRACSAGGPARERGARWSRASRPRPVALASPCRAGSTGRTRRRV